MGLELGEVELRAGRTHDLGTVRLPEPGWLALEITESSGEPLPEGRFLVRVPGSSHAGDILSLVGGRARSRPLSPGLLEIVPFGGRVPLLRREVEVLPGETTTISLQLPRAFARHFRYPPMGNEAYIRETWRNGAGEVLLTGMGTYPSESGMVVERWLAPGVYSVELAFEGTPARSFTLRVDEGEDPTEYALPDPR